MGYEDVDCDCIDHTYVRYVFKYITKNVPSISALSSFSQMYRHIMNRQRCELSLAIQKNVFIIPSHTDLFPSDMCFMPQTDSCVTHKTTQQYSSMFKYDLFCSKNFLSWIGLLAKERGVRICRGAEKILWAKVWANLFRILPAQENTVAFPS